jgi:2-polyprenyl-6-methoxyphenol hydroxylase-like FAD-dependent oxidoreductase
VTAGARDHAVVVGGSIAGLLAARVLADRYGTVTVVERDTLTGAPQHRRAVPQGQHIHALLARGQQILDQLFPGFVQQLAAEGVPVGDFGTSLTWYFDGVPFRKAETGLTCVAAGRPLLEQRIRDRVAALATVKICDGHEVTGLLADSHRRGVTGVRVHRVAEAEGEQRLSADLVVDAAGRGSRLPGWLADLGYPPPDRDTVKMQLVYTTCDFHGPLPYDPIGKDIALIPVATPGRPRGAIFARLPDRYAISLTGIAGDAPPRDREPFLEYVASLPVPEIRRAVAEAEPMGPPVSFRFPASTRIRYDRMRDFPAGLIVLGDAFSHFNPVYGQGMTVAALAADLLQRHLERHPVVRPREFLRDLGRVVSAPWNLAAGADLGFPAVEGRRTLATRFGNAYVSRLQRGATRDPLLSRAFLRVAGLVDPPAALFRPAVLAHTLTGERRPA